MITDERVQYTECPLHDFAAYIDGELTPQEELALDFHLAGCDTCSAVLNDQKLFLNDLEHSLRGDGGIDLPENFARVVVATAESKVTGVRRFGELFNAVFVCAAMVLFILLALGPNARTWIAAAVDLFDQAAAIGSFFGHLIYSFLLGVTIVLRSLGSQFRLDLVLTTALVLIPFGLLMLASRKWLRLDRA